MSIDENYEDALAWADKRTELRLAQGESIWPEEVLAVWVRELRAENKRLRSHLEISRGLECQCWGRP